MLTDGMNVEGTLCCGSAPSSSPSSPRSRLKFLCSHGGKILPKPADGQLKYVGGETRVISVPRDIAFQELMQKLTYMIDGEMILKYQLIPEELDALVSVKTNEDLRHMFDECDRHESAKFPRLRAFLFPEAPVIMENQTGIMEPHALEQRYIDAIKGIILTTATGMKQHPIINVTQQNNLVSSACSSPDSAESYITDTVNNEIMVCGNYPTGKNDIHRVRSSPNICYQHPPSNYPNYYKQYHSSSSQYPKLPVDPNRCLPERLVSVKSIGRSEGARYQVDNAPQHYYIASRQNRASGSSTKCMNYEDCNHCSERRIIDRTRSLVTSPVFLSPQQGTSPMKVWDSITE